MQLKLIALRQGNRTAEAIMANDYYKKVKVVKDF